MKYFAADLESYIAPRSDDYVIRDATGAPIDNLDGDFVYSSTLEGKRTFEALETGVWLAGFADIDDDRLFTVDERGAVEHQRTAREHVEAILALPRRYGVDGVTMCYHNLAFDWPFVRWVLLHDLDFVNLGQYHYNTGQTRYFVGTELGYTVYCDGYAVNFIDTLQALKGSIREMGATLEAASVGGAETMKGETPLVEAGYEVTNYIHESDDPTGRGFFLKGENWTWEQAEQYIDGDILILAKTMQKMGVPSWYDNGVLTTAQYAIEVFNRGDLPHFSRDPQFKVFFAPRYYTRQHQTSRGKTLIWEYPSGTTKICIDQRFEQVSRVSAHADSEYDALMNRQTYNVAAKACYKGGLNWVNPEHIGREIGAGRVYDITSMYPHVYATMPIPRDPDQRFDNVPLEAVDRSRPFVFCATIDAHVKQGCLPALKTRTDDQHNRGMAYEVDSNGEPVMYDGDLVVADQRAVYSPHLHYPHPTWWTSVELDYLLECYEVHEIVIHELIYYTRDRSLERRMREHCKRFFELKNAASPKFNSEGVLVDPGDPFLRNQAKICLNALYGALARTEKPYTESLYIYDEENDVVKNKSKGKVWSGSPSGDAVVGAFITAYARIRLARDANRIGLSRVAYTDTDSLHIIGDDEPEGIDVGDDIGQYKLEARFSEAYYLKPKTYTENVIYTDGTSEWLSTCAGVTKQLRRDEFVVGHEFTDTRRMDARGGSVLVKIKMKVQPPHQVEFKSLEEILDTIAPRYRKAYERHSSRGAKRRKANPSKH